MVHFRCAIVLLVCMFALVACQQDAEQVDPGVVHTNSESPELDPQMLARMQQARKVYHTFSDGEEFEFYNSDGYVISGDIILAETDELLELLAGYETALEGGLIPQGIGSNCPSICYSTLWPNKNIYYFVDSSIQGNDRTALDNAITAWNKSSAEVKLTFVSQYLIAGNPYVKFKKSTTVEGCGSSKIGQANKRDAIGIYSGGQDILIKCFRESTIHHEIGHAVGLRHEQQRCDRDKFVVVSKDEDNFRKRCDSSSKDYGPYNFSSMMHYRFGTNFGVTMTLKSPLPSGGYEGNPNSVGGKSLGAGDIRTINTMY